MIEELLGFDTRFHSKYYLDDVWPHAKRANYFLVPETKWPLSVDHMVWPSVFRYSSIVIDPNYQHLRRMINVKAMDTRHSALELWPSLKAMEDFLGKQDGIRIAVSLNAEKDVFLDEFWCAVLEPRLSMDDLPKEWRHLGYDVADRDMISGLSNCSYNTDEIISLQGTWAHCLNEHGLFSKIDDAIGFRDLSDKRVPAHSPFYVYSLFIGEEIRTDLGS